LHALLKHARAGEDGGRATRRKRRWWKITLKGQPRARHRAVCGKGALRRGKRKRGLFRFKFGTPVIRVFITEPMH